MQIIITYDMDHFGPKYVNLSHFYLLLTYIFLRIVRRS